MKINKKMLVLILAAGGGAAYYVIKSTPESSDASGGPVAGIIDQFKALIPASLGAATQPIVEQVIVPTAEPAPAAPTKAELKAARLAKSSAEQKQREIDGRGR